MVKTEKWSTVRECFLLLALGYLTINWWFVVVLRRQMSRPLGALVQPSAVRCRTATSGVLVRFWHHHAGCRVNPGSPPRYSVLSG